MGSGQSLQDHLQRWETALSELEQISATNKRAIEQDRIYGNAVLLNDGAKHQNDEDGNSVRRHSSLVSFNPTNAVAQPETGNGVSLGSLHRQQQQQQQREHSTANNNNNNNSRPGLSFVVGNGASGIPSSNAPSNPADVAGNRSVGSASLGHPAKHSRQQVQENRRARVSLFKSYEVREEEEGLASTGTLQSGHFAAAAAALSYLLGGDRSCSDRRRRVTLEDIFFAAQLPLHMLHTGSPHLPVMADAVREFLDVDNRFKDEYGLEEVHLDVSPVVGQVELGTNEVGDRQTRMQLPEFQRLLVQECEEDTQAARIVNYDPYVLEQEMLVDAYEDEDETKSPLATSVLGPNPQRVVRQCNPRNDGAYAAIVDVRNAVQLMVTIAEGVAHDTVQVRLREVPVASLFKAMMTAEEGRRARGFLRVFRKDSNPDFITDEISMLWSPELCSGKVLGTTQQGTSASAVSHHISPHIVAVAWVMHLLGGVRPGSHGYGTGLPISDIINRLSLPAEVFIDGALPLEQVYEYAEDYIALCGRDISVHLYPVLTKISREDAVPTISVFDLESIMLDVKKANPDPEAPAHVMVIMYNASVAHNVLYIAEDPQWCIMAGYDAETQTALLIDAHPKTFSRTWSCSLDRLHKSMTGTGYLIFSKNCGEGEEAVVGAPTSLAPTVERRLELVQRQHALHTGSTSTAVHLPDAQQDMTFPSIPVMPTIIAMACNRLGLPASFSHVVHALPFEMSALIIRALTLESLHVCLTEYLRVRGCESDFTAVTVHGETDEEGQQRLEVRVLEELIEASLDADHALVLHYDAQRLQVNGANNPFGNLGVVTGYSKELRSVRVSDTNPNSYLRSWSVPLVHLHEALQDSEDTRQQRRRGVLRVSRLTDEEKKNKIQFTPTQTRRFSLDLLPVQNIFHASPSPHFQAMSFAFSQLGYFFSPEEIFYEAYLTTMDDQRRRGSQAFAWRDVDVSLSVISKMIDASFMALVCSKFLESRTAAQSGARGPGLASPTAEHPSAAVSVMVLDDVDVQEELEALLEAAVTQEDRVLLVNYDVQQTHHLPDLGRSVALVKSYDKARQVIELWDAEYALFGLSFTVTKDDFVRMSDLTNMGRTPYGLVLFTRQAEGTLPKRKKIGLMAAPKSTEEEEAQDAAVQASHERRERQAQTRFVGEEK